jgi:hypothetical protein
VNTLSNPICLICGLPIELDEENLVVVNLNEGDTIYAHSRCAKGLSKILNMVDYQRPRELGLHKNIVKEVAGKIVLIRRDFPNQYIPILIFFQLHLDTPQPIAALRQWLELNQVVLSNPSVPLKRLLDKNALAVVVDDDTALYFITDIGSNELREYVDETTKEKMR